MTSAPNQPELFIAFPDGVYDYVCSECTMICCRNSRQFDGDIAGELKQLVQIYPVLRHTQYSRRGDVITFTTASGQCFFLNSESRCSIELDHGKALKPTTCRLFPFHSLDRLHTAVAVRPNFLCPLRLTVPARPGEVQGSHARIENDLRESHYLRASNLVTMARLALPRSIKGREILCREIEFRDACGLALGKEKFSGLLRERVVDVARFDDVVGRVARFIGLEQQPVNCAHDSTDDLFLALASGLRLSLTQFSSDVMLTILMLCELWLRRVLSLAPPQPPGPATANTPRGANELLGTMMPVFRFLALISHEIPIRVRSKKVTTFGEPTLTFSAFKILTAVHQDALSLDELERLLSQVDSIGDRMALLGELGRMTFTRRGGVKKSRFSPAG